MKGTGQQIRRRNTMLRDLSDMVTDLLVKHGVSQEAATEASEELAFQIHRRWAGITFAFPTRDDLARSRLKKHLIAEYTGGNADDLVRKYGVTEDFIYAVLREHRREKSANQPSFDF